MIASTRTARDTGKPLRSVNGRDIASGLAYRDPRVEGPRLRETLDRLAERARAEARTRAEYLLAGLQGEVSARDAHGGESRIRSAPIPARKSLEELSPQCAKVIRRPVSPLLMGGSRTVRRACEDAPTSGHKHAMGPDRQLPRMTGTLKIQIGDNFFKRELDAYSNWRDAFARELLQNSIDAGANEISIGVTLEGGSVRVRVEDNGVGMTRDQFRDVFLVLGATTKAGGGKIGGFGRARILLCFGQERYRVESGDWVAEGSGDVCCVIGGGARRSGTLFEITTRDSDLSPLKRAFERVLTDSDLSADVKLNGLRIPSLRVSDWRRVLHDAKGREWAKVTVAPASGGYAADRYIARVKGLQTFHFTLLRNLGEDLLVEINADRSREVLTVSRDALKFPYSAQVNELRERFLTNRAAALRPDELPIRTVVRGARPLRFDGLDEGAPADARPAITRRDVDGGRSDDAIAAFISSASSATDVRAVQGRAGSHTSTEAAADDSGMLPFTIPDDHSVLPFDCVIVAETDDQKTRRLVELWSPRNWDPQRDAHRLALLQMWTEAVHVSLDALRAECPRQSSFEWNVGWYFGDPDAHAVCMGTSETGAALLLNPVDALGGNRYGPVADPRTWRMLLAAATHEVAHIPSGEGHDERFASTLTSFYARIDHDVALRRIASAALPHDGDRLISSL